LSNDSKAIIRASLSSLCPSKDDDSVMRSRHQSDKNMEAALDRRLNQENSSKDSLDKIIGEEMSEGE